jgi:hypothetical protein
MIEHGLRYVIWRIMVLVTNHFIFDIAKVKNRVRKINTTLASLRCIDLFSSQFLASLKSHTHTVGELEIA